MDPRQIFDTGEGFREACALFDLQAREGRAVLTLVMGMNAAYALEAYLKCLAFLEKGAFQKTHDFVILFNDLEKRTQQELKEQHDKEAVGDSRFAAAQRQGIPSDLDTLLQVGKDSFVKFRYAFEGNGNKTVFGLGKFMRIVRKKFLPLNRNGKRLDECWRGDSRLINYSLKANCSSLCSVRS
jgi:hypothetical protein